MIRARWSAAGVWMLLAVVPFTRPQSTAQSKSVNPLQLSFHHVTASVADLDKEAAWYERVLGFSRGERLGAGSDFQAFHMTFPGYRIDLIWQKGSARHRQGQAGMEQGWLHIVFKTPMIDAAYKFLCGAGDGRKAG